MAYVRTLMSLWELRLYADFLDSGIQTNTLIKRTQHNEEITKMLLQDVMVPATIYLFSALFSTQNAGGP
ncbi:hypothetical protein D2U88_02855 [Flagellimonas aequoris]|uniref:Uncharacterized protein n=1 Tax=Flagellimonas aequoris TaxID=2306997 RepID=A0A418NBG9_9FLAO|nr:hypothetical protein D2U88_02855 [Allomuricauda aequoris]